MLRSCELDFYRAMAPVLISGLDIIRIPASAFYVPVDREDNCNERFLPRFLPIDLHPYWILINQREYSVTKIVRAR